MHHRNIGGNASPSLAFSKGNRSAGQENNMTGMLRQKYSYQKKKKKCDSNIAISTCETQLKSNQLQ